jgi:hypothetical protein
MTTMYCPKCLNNSLSIKESGVVEIFINEKKMDSGRFLFSAIISEEELYADAKNKLNEFIKWLSNFSNLEPLKKIKFITTDVKCELGCSTAFTEINAVGQIVQPAQLNSILAEISEKYDMELVLDA